MIRHLVKPFARMAAKRMPQAGSAPRPMLEAPIRGKQYLRVDGVDPHHLCVRCEKDSRLLDWLVPYADTHAEPASQRGACPCCR